MPPKIDRAAQLATIVAAVKLLNEGDAVRYSMTEDDGDEPLVLHGKVKKVKDRSTDAPTVTIEVPTFMGNGDPGLLMLPEVGMTYHAVVLERTGATTLTAAARARINILCAGNPHTWGSAITDPIGRKVLVMELKTYFYIPDAEDGSGRSAERVEGLKTLVAFLEIGEVCNPNWNSVEMLKIISPTLRRLFTLKVLEEKRSLDKWNLALKEVDKGELSLLSAYDRTIK